MSEFNELIVRLRRMGATVTRAGSGHWKISLNGATVVAAYSPSDHRAVHNFRAELRRAGILLRPSKHSLSPAALAFLRQFEDTDRIRGFGDIPPCLQAKSLIRVSNRYKHGKLNGWVAWITPEGQKELKRSHDAD